MMEPNETSIQRIEARMRLETMRWLTRMTAPACDADRLKPDILALTGMVVRTGDDLARASAMVSRLLISQRRMAKSGHPRYDANRHILLKSTMIGIDRELQKTPLATKTRPIVHKTGGRA